MPVEFSCLPFEPKRVFTISNVPKNNIRGNHSHYITKQLLVCVYGSILVGLDDGFKKQEITISDGQYVLIENLIWDWQKFLTGNDFMLVFCSTPYDIKDYIFDYNQFLSIKNQ